LPIKTKMHSSLQTAWRAAYQPITGLLRAFA
jgi:hypothetical protein